MVVLVVVELVAQVDQEVLDVIYQGKQEESA